MLQLIKVKATHLTEKKVQLMQKKEILMENLLIKISVLEMRDQNIKQEVVDNKMWRRREVSKIKKEEMEIMLS
jgi:hypothetical protein